MTPKARIPLEITVPRLAVLYGVSRATMLRRLRDDGVVLRRRGKGTRRQHVYVLFAELLAQAPHIVEAIDWSKLLLERTRRPEPATKDDDDERDD